MPSPETYDVIIIGGGPVGLLLAYQLTRFELSVCIVEKQDKDTPEGRYGRAITLFPRTLELLDQLDLVQPMLQQGFACRSSVTYKDGVRQQVHLSSCLSISSNQTGQVSRKSMDFHGEYPGHRV